MVFQRGRFQAARLFQEIDARVLRRNFGLFHATLAQFRGICDGFLERSVFGMSIRRRLVRDLSIVLNPDDRFNGRTTDEGDIFVAGGILDRRTVTFFAATSMFLLTFARAGFANGPFRANMTVRRLGIVLVNGLLSRFNDGSDFRAGFVANRFTRFIVLDSSMVGVRRADLIAVGRCPFTFVILADSACTIDVQIKDRCGINVGFFDRVGDRHRDFHVLQVQESGYQRIAILGRLLKRNVCILRSPRLRYAQGRRRTYAISQDMCGLRVFVTNSHFEVSEGDLRRVRVCLVSVFSSSLGRVQIALRLSVNDEDGLVCFVSGTLVIQDRCLHAIIPVDLVAIMFFQII